MAGETQKILTRLRTIWVASDGYFVTGMLVTNESENRTLGMLRKNNPGDFQIIYSDRALLLRLTESFLARHGLPLSDSPLVPAEPHTRFDILKRVVVGAFALEHNLNIVFDDRGFEHDRIDYTLDPLDTPVGEVKRPYDGLLLTIPSRVEPLLACGIRTVAPRALYRTWNQRVIETYRHSPAPLCAAEQVYRDEYQKVLERGFLGENAFWPRSEQDDLHTDSREYPGFEYLLDGAFKYRTDKAALKGPHDKREGRLFGVWKRKDKKSQLKTPKVRAAVLDAIRKAEERNKT